MSDLRTKAVPFPLFRPIAVRMPGAVKYKFLSIMTKNLKRRKNSKSKKYCPKQFFEIYNVFERIFALPERASFKLEVRIPRNHNYKILSN